MFIEFEYVTNKGKNKRIYSKRLSICKCDQCGVKYKKQGDLSKLSQTFCSRRCQGLSFRNGGSSYEKRKKTYRKNWNADHPGKTTTYKEKLKATWKEKLGVENPFQDESIKKKARQTMLNRYGVEHSMQSTNFLQKRIKTFNEKYGTDNPASSPKVARQIKKTNMMRYGFASPLSNDDVQKKRKQTIIKKYGVQHPHQDPAVRERFKKTMIKRYGVECAPRNPSIREKMHQTMKKRGTYGKSSVEDALYDMLSEIYGEQDVERQAKLNGWRIDFLIKSRRIYVELDGEYWHGLDRSLKMIKESVSPRDVSILKKYELDRKQDQWCTENNIKLIRITDKQFKKMTVFQIKSKVENK